MKIADHDVELRRRPAPVLDTRQLVAHADAALGGETARLLEGDRRKIERRDLQPLLREPDAVASFAVGDAQRALAAPQARLLRGEKGVGRGAEDVLGGAEALVPALQMLVYDGLQSMAARKASRPRMRAYQSAAAGRASIIA